MCDFKLVSLYWATLFVVLTPSLSAPAMPGATLSLAEVIQAFEGS